MYFVFFFHIFGQNVKHREKRILEKNVLQSNVAMFSCFFVVPYPNLKTGCRLVFCVLLFFELTFLFLNTNLH